MSKIKKLGLQDLQTLVELRHKLANAKRTEFGNAIRLAVKQDRVKEAIKMINDQRRQGHEQTLEWIVGHSTLQLIDRLTC